MHSTDAIKTAEINGKRYRVEGFDHALRLAWEVAGPVNAWKVLSLRERGRFLKVLEVAAG